MIKTFIFLIVIAPSIAYATDVNVLELLQRDLGDEILVISKTEIRYCPDNTCEMYLALNAHEDFASYVYLHLFHKSDYLYLNLEFNNRQAFKESAIEEPIIRKNVSEYCPSNPTDITCILDTMSKSLGFYNGFGRYDEGNFCYGYDGLDNVGGCTKP